MIFRKVAARKARHGFFGSINSNSIEFVGQAVTVIKSLDNNAIVEVINNMGHCEAKLYTNDDDVAQKMSAFLNITNHTT